MADHLPPTLAALIADILSRSLEPDEAHAIARRLRAVAALPAPSPADRNYARHLATAAELIEGHAGTR